MARPDGYPGGFARGSKATPARNRLPAGTLTVFNRPIGTSVQTGCFARSCCSSPAWYISFRMSQPPTNSPLT